MVICVVKVSREIGMYTKLEILAKNLHTPRKSLNVFCIKTTVSSGQKLGINLEIKVYKNLKLSTLMSITRMCS